MRKVFVGLIVIVLMVLDLRCSFAQLVSVHTIKPGFGDVVLYAKAKGGKRFVAGSFFKFHQHKQNPQQ